VAQTQAQGPFTLFSLIQLESELVPSLAAWKTLSVLAPFHAA
jgi:hypothetical protein